MKKNYFKSYFDSFGILATLIVLAVAAVVGLAVYKLGIVGGQFAAIAVGALLVLFGGSALLGLTGLRTPKVTMTDFVRINMGLAGIEMGVFAILAKASLIQYIIYFAAAALLLVEVIVRLTAITEESGQVGIKAYFGALGFRYNPMLVTLAGIVVAVGVAVLTKLGVTILADSHLLFYILGGVISLIAVLLIFAFEADSDVSIMDLVFAVIFIASIIDAVILTPVMVFMEIKYLILALAVSGIGLFIRAVFYDKDCIYDNHLHKSRTYYRNVFGKYSLMVSLIITALVLGAIIVAISYASTGCNMYKYFEHFLKLSSKINPATIIMIGGIASAAILAILMILLVVFRGFSSTDPVKVDWVIATMILASAWAIPAALYFIFVGNISLLINNLYILIAVIVAAVTFVLGIALQFVRIRNYDVMASIIAAEASQRMAQKAEEKKAAEEAKEETAKQEAEAKAAADPFALSEEDEALYEATYGVQEKKEEKPAEPTNPYEEETETEEEAPVEEETEEVVYEEEAEEVVYEEEEPVQTKSHADEVSDDDFEAFLNSIPEKKEEKPAEEPVVEETPVQSEEAPAEEDADEDEDDEEEEAEVIDYDDDEEEAEEPAEEIEKTKEADIQVQEYVAVDEEGNPKKIKRKFSTKMMFAPYETKEYYNEVKNYLMMYRAKGRNSSRCETFRYKGLVAKVALGGKAVKVFLALDPSIIEQYPKYHLKDFSEKKQYAEVPVMIKVRSDRSLRYFKELVDLMFANRLVKPKKNYEPQNFLPSMIPNGEAILGNLGLASYYLQDMMNVNGIPEELPDNLIDYLPMIPGEELEDEEVEAVAYLDTLCTHFNEGDEITLEVLKSMHICQKGNILRIKARGTVDRKLIIYAEKFDEDALKMLMCTNGTAVRIVR